MSEPLGGVTARDKLKAVVKEFLSLKAPVLVGYSTEKGEALLLVTEQAVVYGTGDCPVTFDLLTFKASDQKICDAILSMAAAERTVVTERRLQEFAVRFANETGLFPRELLDSGLRRIREYGRQRIFVANVMDLEGEPLDWVVAQCEGVDAEAFMPGQNNFSSNRELAGAIAEREHIGHDYRGFGLWESWDDKSMPARRFDGATPMLADMRCYVASVKGDSLEIPDRFASLVVAQYAYKCAAERWSGMPHCEYLIESTDIFAALDRFNIERTDAKEQWVEAALEEHGFNARASQAAHAGLQRKGLKP